jgi:endonuclease YncB( thermonuclease family)
LFRELRNHSKSIRRIVNFDHPSAAFLPPKRTTLQDVAKATFQKLAAYDFTQTGITSIALLAWLTYSTAQAADLSGVPRIVDGDTLAIGTTKIRLEGIDAPETDQVCLNANGAHWTCGIDARDQLAAHIAGQEINCTSHGTDAYRRRTIICPESPTNTESKQSNAARTRRAH